MAHDFSMDLAAVFDRTADIISHIEPDEWDRPTPCSEWNVREVVAHLVLGNRAYVSRMRGEPPERSPFPRPGDDDVLGDDPARTYRCSAASLLDEIEAPDAMERTYELPFTTVTGEAALRIRMTDNLVHGWDLSRATGHPLHYSDDVILRLAEDLAPMVGRLPRDGEYFGPIEEIPDGARPIDVLAALLGRKVGAETG
ncbi:TIGR03086 family metal-binding protein [Salininema proteolyticum]|uniref:TIGR03086 family metal-binding protein n=1 Tax=Salininema proteolyticum TaxID=1607685 RepID=A0ABV8TUE2_9ACTN